MISLSSRKGPVLSFPIQGTAQSSLSTVDAIRSQWTKHQYLDASSALTKLWKTTLFSMYKEQEDERYSSQRNLLGKISPGLTPMRHSTIGLTAGSVDHSPSSSMKGVPWWTSPLQGKDFLQVCKYLQQLLASALMFPAGSTVSLLTSLYDPYLLVHREVQCERN